MLLSRARAVTAEQLCLELGVAKRLVHKWRARIQSALASPSASINPLQAIDAAQCAIRANDKDLVSCEPQLRALAFAMGAKRTERGTLVAIMAALVCLTDGTPLATVRSRYPGAKSRNIQKWKRDILTVLDQSVALLRDDELTANELCTFD